VPGTYIIVDHSIFRAFNKGALGMLHVEGTLDSSIYSGRLAEGIYNPEGGVMQTMPATEGATPLARTPAERIEFGGRFFAQNCAACHQANGQGIPGAFPPLARSDFLNADAQRAIGIVLNGKSGPVTVNGVTFNGVMPALNLTDEDVANVLSYVYSQWGNRGAVITPEQVTAVRAASPRPSASSASAH